MFDKIDRATELDAAVEVDGIGHRVRISLTLFAAAGQPERHFEVQGDISRLVLARPPQPFAQIGADRRDAVLPDAIDCRRKVVIVARGGFLDDFVEDLSRLIQRSWAEPAAACLALKRSKNAN